MGEGESTEEGRWKRGTREERKRVFTMGKGGGQIEECERDSETPVEESFNFSLSLKRVSSLSPLSPFD